MIKNSSDNIIAKILKYGSENVTKNIKVTMKLQEQLNKIKQRVVTIVQKPGTSGLIVNLRTITSLSILRKFQLKRKLDAKAPPNQAAHKQGQSATRHIYTTRQLKKQ